MIRKLIRFIRLLWLSAHCVGTALLHRLSIRVPAMKNQDSDAEPSFVIYSIIPWSGVWQRPQHFATRLAQRFKVLYVDPVGIQHLVAATAPPPETLTPVTANLTIWRPRVLPGGKTRSGICRLNDAMLLNPLKKLMRDLEMRAPVFVTNTPLGDTLAAALPWTAVVYDVIDDFIAASWAPADAEAREQRLLKTAHTVFTGTYSLFEKKQQFHSSIEFIPCGVETEHFLKASDPDIVPAPEMTGLARPILGYFGGLNERLDAQLLVHIATHFAECTIVLIGPVFADFGLSDFQDEWASVLPGPDAPGFRLKSCPPNIRLTGIRPYQELPRYLCAFDLCLLPYVLNDVTRDIHPVKILEYLAAGKPVVSTPLPDVKRFYSGIVEVAETREAFLEAITRSLSGDSPEKRRERTEFARSKTWDQMAEKMLNNIMAVSASPPAS